MHPTPEPGPQARALGRLEGTWRGIEPTPTGGEGPIGTYDNHFILDGFVMALDYSQVIGTGVRYRMHALLGWDTALERYYFHWYDSLGGVGADIYGPQLDGDRLVLEGPDPVQGGRARFTWLLADDVHTLTIEFSKDQETWTQAMRAEYRRVQ